MFRPAARLVLRQPLSRAGLTRTVRRSLGTAPAQRSRSWKNSTLRLAAAGAVVWWYNTSDVFAESPALVHTVPQSQNESEQLPTIETLAEERRKRAPKNSEASSDTKAVAAEVQGGGAGTTGVEDLEDEADQQGAFNPETGEINWDCPCLGGMAHGPCGEEFKSAFSCFVYSKEEPKGMDCIDKFKGMQECFREYPEIYGSELDEDDDMSSAEPSIGAPPNETSPTPAEADVSVKTPAPSINTNEATDDKPPPNKSSGERAKEPSEHKESTRSDAAREEHSVSDTVPDKWHDQRSENPS